VSLRPDYKQTKKKSLDTLTLSFYPDTKKKVRNRGNRNGWGAGAGAGWEKEYFV
jgi:hypothetical protein